MERGALRVAIRASFAAFKRPYASAASSTYPILVREKILRVSLFSFSRHCPLSIANTVGSFSAFRRPRKSFHRTLASSISNHPSNENDRFAEAEADSSGSSIQYSGHIRSYYSHYINGKWMIPSYPNASTIDVTDSNNGSVIATIPEGIEETTLEAIVAAKTALPAWSQQTTPKERLDFVRVFLERFRNEQRVDEIVDRLAVELGCTKAFARKAQHMAPVYQIQTLLDLLEDSSGGNGDQKGTFEWEYSAGNCTVVKEAIGVVGAITPWNYPLHQIVLKVIPALVAGCTVVLKPSEVTPLVAYSFAEAIEEAGFPAGVFNMVQGAGLSCGEVLARHPSVNMVSFTGSTEVGKTLAREAANSETPKEVRTELGGKSAAILLDDADFAKVVPTFVKQLTSNTGQSCNALSRMLIPRDRYQEVLEIAAKTMEKEVVGCCSLRPESTIGPLVSQKQYESVRSYIQSGISQGARIVTGGLEPPKGTSDSGGYFVTPTLFADVTNDMTIAQEEIFGPVLCAIPYDTEEEAIAIANDTPYGLNNAVASRNLQRALAIASRLESGAVMINKTHLDFQAPFGGYKQSGNAREWGLSGLEEFLVTKTVNVPLEDYRSIVYGTEISNTHSNNSSGSNSNR